MTKRRRGPTKAKPWVAMRQGQNQKPNDYHEWLQSIADEHGITTEELADLTHHDEVWLNDRYRCSVRYVASDMSDAEDPRLGLCHLSIHSHTRGTSHDWRHFQRIKNDVMGPNREALEIYPDERRLVDTSNEYHLWVLPEGVWAPFGFDERYVDYETINKAPGKGRQRAEMV